MANYVWNKVLCDKETLEKYFIDDNPFGDGSNLDKPYITFNKLFDVKSLKEYGEKIGIYISYGFSFSYHPIADGRYEIMFCTRWEYPIEAIKRAITLSPSTEWYAVEENCIYVSRFYWDNKIKEDVLYIEDGYYKWLDSNMEFADGLTDPDHDVWYYLQVAKEKWQEREDDSDSEEMSIEEYEEFRSKMCGKLKPIRLTQEEIDKLKKEGRV